MRNAAEWVQKGRGRHAARWATAALGVVTVLGLATTVPPASALELRDHGPTVAFGYARKSGEDLFFPSVGWRWRWGFCDAVDDMLSKVGTDLSWYVEPMVAPVLGGQDTIEVQVVPGLRFEAVDPWLGTAVPYLEGGIGLMYTGLDDIGLGSNILFSDNVGLGFTLRDSGWSFGYRYRHSSHAGLWAETNSGLDAHYVTARYDLRCAPANP
jgi:hypothetical protein